MGETAMTGRPTPLKNLLRRRLVESAVARGADRAKAEQAVAAMEAEKGLLDWLLSGGWEQLVELVLRLIDLLG